MSKGGSTSTSVAVPEYIEEAAKRNLNKAERISQIGPMPYYGADVASLTPMQEAAAQNIADTASVFGTAGGNMSQQDIRGGMPEPTTFAGGVRGYSSAPMYEQSLEALAAARPGQKEYIDSFFIDPYTGRAGSNVQAPIDYTSLTPGGSGDLGGINLGQTGGGGGDDPFFPPVTPPYVPPVAPPVGPGGVDVPFTLPPIVDGPYVGDPSDGFDDSLSTNTPALTTEELKARLEAENRLRQEDARRRADELAALAASNDLSIFDQNQLDGNNSTNTGSNAAGLSAEGTNAGALDPRGVNQIPGYPNSGSPDPYGQTYGTPLSQQDFVLDGNSLLPPGPGLISGGGADGVGNFGQVGDFFGGIGDKLGITNYDGQGTGLLSGLNLTGPLAEGNPGYITGGRTGNAALDDDRPAGPGDTGYEQAALAENLTTGAQDGIIYADDRRQVWVGGEMVANVKSASEAKERLATAVANKPSPTTGFTQAQTDLAQALFAQGVPAAEVRAAVLAQ